MGVKLLAKLLKQECYNETKKVHLSCLYGKKICIDISIYLYRFKGQNTLIESFYVMCSLFKKYNIIPIFIFDGKPPIEKSKELENRRKGREKAKINYEKLLEKGEENLTEKNLLELDRLKRSMVKITKEDVILIKDLLDSYGMAYMTALGEADILCASLILKKKVYAVLTEDMDLFAYGSPIVLRYFSLSQHSCILYNLKIILNKLKVTKEDFQLICVLSGNDYYDNKKNIYYYLKIYKKYNKSKSNKKLLDWLLENNYVVEDEIVNIEKILGMYVNIKRELTRYKYIPIKFGSICEESLKNILKKERFIF